MAKKKQVNNFLSVLKKHALEDFNITENSSPLLKELAKLEIADPVEEMNWHLMNIKNKLGDPFELINKTIGAEDIEQWDKYINTVLPDFQNNGFDTYKQLAANVSINLNDTEINEMANALASMQMKMSNYNKDISLYQQQIQGLKNKNKYKNKDIMGDIEGYKLIEENNRLLNEIDNTQPISNINTNTNYEPDISDLDPDTLANLTDTEIEEWAQGADDYQRAIDLRQQAREQTGWKPIEQQVEQQQETQQEQRKEQVETNKNNTETQTEKFNEENQEQKTRQRDTQQETKKKNKTKKSKLDVDVDRSDRIKRVKGKKISKGKGKYKVSPKAKNFKSIVANTMVNAVTDEAEKLFKETSQEIFDEVFESGRYDVKDELENWGKDWEKVNFKHPDQMSDIELSNLDDDQFEQLKMYANGNKSKVEEWTNRRNKQKALNIENNIYNEPIYQDTRNPRTYRMRQTEYDVDKNGKVTINKLNDINEVEIEANRRNLDDINTKHRKSINRSSEPMDDIFSWMKKHKISALDVGFNLFGAIGDYKNSRRQGHGVVSSLGRAATTFVVGEMMGFWGSLAFGAVKGGAKLAIKGTELLYKENRKMNSAANNQAFGNAEFYDTQQLATMRQSGMEMAKMAQYNLQQTLMGNEATYLHR